MSEREGEREAIARLKAGDIGGLELLVKLYQVEALEAACLITHDYAMAEDVVQSAFLRAYECIDQFDSSRRFRPWFLRSVLNSALNATTSVSQSHTPLDQAVNLRHGDGSESKVVGIPGHGAGPEQLFEAAETREEIFDALEKLSPGQRAAVVLRYYLDLSDTEVSHSLHIPPGTVRRRLHDARQRLRLLLPRKVI